MNNHITIAIDGPASSGKSSVAKLIAKEQGYIYIDTGAMYRMLTLKALRKELDLENEDELFQLLKNTDITFEKQGEEQIAFLDNEDVTTAIRQTDVTNNVSVVSSHQKIRQELVSKQQEMSNDHNAVMDGRDIGTVVLPEATLKIFLEAEAEERAKRRYEENIQNGIDSDYETILEDIKKRDYYDSNRKESPLKKAHDAQVIDSTTLSIEEVKDEILKLLQKNMNLHW